MKLSWRYQVQVMGVSFGSWWNSPDGEQKTMHHPPAARSPIDSVLGDETVKVPQDFISELMFTRIDYEGRLRSCLGCRRQPRIDHSLLCEATWKAYPIRARRSQLIKPSELALVNFKILICHVDPENKMFRWVGFSFINFRFLKSWLPLKRLAWLFNLRF